MSVQGHLLDTTVIGCRNLKDTEWISRQDPYVVLEYAGNKYRTKTDTDGGRNPSFNEKFLLPLIEGLREINFTVWNSNTLSPDDFIGSGKIMLQKALTEGYHDSSWPLTTRNGRRAGELRVILHYSSPKGSQKVTSAQHMAPVHQSQPGYPPSNPVYYPSTAGYPPSDFAYYPPTAPCPPPSTPYPPQPSDHCCYPPAYGPYPPPTQTPYPPTYGAGAYTPSAPYPPQSYPPPTYPPHGYGSYYPPY